ncbi:MAG: HrpE/YscL family type III secretion apparatus protein [Aeromonadales bacterium]|jgi:type III secretion protein L|nr:HrpE/YscL family type III secretion apparatus protein [Aeromonadales bacterium]MDY2890478.1 HrpE/YscL family type III secretion apparatus protein [Succinivibrio sp.]
MPDDFQLVKAAVKPGPGVHVVKKDDYADFREASRLLDLVKKASADAAERARKAYFEQRERGYKEGLEQGREEYSEKIVEMVMSQVDSIAALEKQLTDAVYDAVVKIIGSLDRRDLVERVVHQGLSYVRGCKSITLRVCPDDEKILRASLGSVLANGQGGYVRLAADPNLRAGDCVLETEQGVVESSLSTQLKVLRKALDANLENKGGA